MAINATVDSVVYEGIEAITAGGKTVELSEVFSGSQSITANGTYDVGGKAEVVVNVPAESTGGAEPTGSINITTNGTHDVADYAEAVVNVPQEGYDVDDIVSTTDMWNKAENIETNVTTIRAYAFAGRTMRKVTAPNLTKLSFRTFIGCGNLAELDAPNLAFFGAGSGETFLDCTSLTTVNFPNADIEKFGSALFKGCTSLVNVNLPSLTKLPASIFENCKSLVSISLPNAKTYAYSTTETAQFKGCTSLSEVSLPLQEVGFGNMFENCTSLEEISLPALTFLGGTMFAGCTALKKVDLGDALTTAATTYPFKNCTALETVILRYNGVVAGTTNTFAYATQAKTVYVPAAQLEAYQADSYWGDAAQTKQGVTLATIEGSEYE